MKIETKFTHESVDHSQENDVHAVITLKAPKLDWEKKRQPICVIPVIDISSSMSGEKLDFAKKSVLKLLDQLQPGDYCGVVAFGSDIFEISEPREMTQSQKEELKTKVGALGVSGCTNFSGGMRKALEWAKDADLADSVTKRIIMFTDGHANQGEARGRDLIPLCKSLLGNASLSAFGYGTDADQELLADLATEGKGNYAFIKNPDDALTAFAKELGGLLSQYAQNIVVDVAPFNGHKIEEVLSDVDVEEKDGKFMITLPEILSEEERHIVLSVKTSKQTKALPRGMNVLDVKVSYDQVSDGDKTHHNEEIKAKIKFVKSGSEQSEPTADVMKIVGVALTVQAQIEAEEQAKAGNFAGAQQIFAANAGVLRSQGLISHAQVSDNLGSNYTSSVAYASSDGYRSSMKKGMSRSVGSSKGVADDLVLMDCAVSNSAMDNMEQVFTGDAEVGKVTGSIDVSGGSLSPVAEEAVKLSASKKKSASKSRSNRW
jgi:Ca-activated chloride channel family protein